jgi:outer membrane receptor for ferrienterochelin and colicins
MKTIIRICIFISVWIPSELFAQHIEGQVFIMNVEHTPIPLPGANVYLEESKTGTITDSMGYFRLHKQKYDQNLILSFMGYINDTIDVSRNPQKKLTIVLQPTTTLLNTVDIKEKQDAQFMLRSEPVNTKNLSGREFKKAACCNLSESFESTASVDVGYSDAITGAKQIMMLGLAGVYSLIQLENIPYMRGLVNNYGLTYVPGTWMESIQISKGAASVKNGYESISGMINVEYKKPDHGDKFFFNVLGNSFGRMELNSDFSYRIKEKWSSRLYLHGGYLNEKHDFNEDAFLDMPLNKQISIMKRWKYNGGNLKTQFGFIVLKDIKNGGQKFFDEKLHLGSTLAYGTYSETDRYQLFAKGGYIFPNKEYASIATINTLSFHDQNSYFGLNDYDARQISLSSNIIYQSIIGTSDNEISMGFTYAYDKYDEVYNDSLFISEESVPGIYLEYTRYIGSDFTALMGIRNDYHNIYGNLFVPRLHFRYQLNKNTAIRASAGKGYRVPHVYAENMGLLISSRNFLFLDEVEIEEAWNYGVFISKDFLINNNKASLNMDFYRTDFLNQFVVDVYSDPSGIIFYNLQGLSYSNSFQTEFNLEPVKGLDIILAYRFNDVKQSMDGRIKSKALLKKHKGILNLSYATKWDKWRFDYTFQYNGKSNIPPAGGSQENLFINQVSPEFLIMNAQITKAFKHWEIYSGLENITGFVQKDPVLSADTPFSTDFDASRIWGPLAGRKFYTGIRLKI